MCKWSYKLDSLANVLEHRLHLRICDRRPVSILMTNSFLYPLFFLIGLFLSMGILSLGILFLVNELLVVLGRGQGHSEALESSLDWLLSYKGSPMAWMMTLPVSPEAATC